VASLPTNYEWAVGFFKQACYDYFHGCGIRKLAGWQYAQALSLAQLQQAAEKAMKAAVFWENKKRLGRDDPAVFSHQIWGDAIKRERHLQALKKGLLQSIGAPEKKIEELERLAPHGLAGAANTEYPWEERGEILTPAAFFSDSARADEAAQLEGIAGAIVLHVSGRNRTFTTHFELIKAQMLMEQEST
jgi:hypothetical protein